MLPSGRARVFHRDVVYPGRVNARPNSIIPRLVDLRLFAIIRCSTSSSVDLLLGTYAMILRSATIAEYHSVLESSSQLRSSNAKLK